MMVSDDLQAVREALEYCRRWALKDHLTAQRAVVDDALAALARVEAERNPDSDALCDVLLAWRGGDLNGEEAMTAVRDVLEADGPVLGGDKSRLGAGEPTRDSSEERESSIVVPQWARRHSQHCPANQGGACLRLDGCPSSTADAFDAAVRSRRGSSSLRSSDRKVAPSTDTADLESRLGAAEGALLAAEQLIEKLGRERAEDEREWVRVREAAAATSWSAVEEVLAVYMGVRTEFDLGFSCELVDEVRATEASLEAARTALRAMVAFGTEHPEDCGFTFGRSCECGLDEAIELANDCLAVVVSEGQKEELGDDSESRPSAGKPTGDGSVVPHDCTCSVGVVSAECPWHD